MKVCLEQEQSEHSRSTDDALSVLQIGVLQMALAIHLSIAFSNEFERLKWFVCILIIFKISHWILIYCWPRGRIHSRIKYPCTIFQNSFFHVVKHVFLTLILWNYCSVFRLFTPNQGSRIEYLVQAEGRNSRLWLYETDFFLWPSAL